MHVCAGAHRGPEEVVESSGAGVPGSSELLDMGAGNHTWAPWKSSVCSYLLSHPSSLAHFYLDTRLILKENTSILNMRRLRSLSTLEHQKA